MLNVEKQAIFNKVAKHLLKQSKQSGDKVSCKYKDSEGNKCAIGCLIPKRLYKEHFDYGLGVSVGNPEMKTTLEKALKLSKPLDANDNSFLSYLQSIHDNILPLNWSSKLKEFAKRYQLNAKVLNAKS